MEPSGRGFHFRSGRLFCERVPVARLAAEYGTPCYVMSAGSIRGAVREIAGGFAGLDPLICYAVKANSTMAILRLVANEGCGAEVVSGGELYRALKAGIAPSRIVFSGVGKTAVEMAGALRRGILAFNVESLPELRLIGSVARRLGVRAPVMLRVNPHVDAHTHRYITTGTAENKFGVDLAHAENAFVEAVRTRGVDLAGIHSHIGSQITAIGPFVKSVIRINALLGRLSRRGISLRIRNLGGGFGISYRDGQPRLNARSLARALEPHIRRGRGMRLIVEPGRYLVGEAGILLTRVIRVKKGVRKTFVIADAGMDNLIRPCLYRAHHEVVPCRLRRGESRRVDIVGPVCESADFLALDRILPPVKAGDLLAVMGAGAYGSSMSSNYNGRRRAAEILVDGSSSRLIRRREKYADLTRGEI